MTINKVTVSFHDEIQDAIAFHAFFDHPTLVLDADGNCVVSKAVADRLIGFQAARSGLVLEQTRTDALRDIDAAAETARQGFLTPGLGQAMTYQHKQAEAEALPGDQEPIASNYPFLSACLGVDGDTLEAVAASVRARSDQWRTLATEIEGKRMRAKHAIRNAATPTEIDTIVSTLKWPEPD